MSPEIALRVIALFRDYRPPSHAATPELKICEW